MQGPDDDIPDYQYHAGIGVASALAAVFVLVIAVFLLTQCS